MSDLVTALGPGEKLSSLTSFAPHYINVRRGFNDLIVLPHLEAIEIEDTSKSNLLSLLTNGKSRFEKLSNVGLQAARKVVSYDSTFSALVEVVNIQVLVLALQRVAQVYANHGAESEATLQFFADFTASIASIEARIVSLDAALAQLDSQIQAQSDALASKNVVTTLWQALKTLYKLASTPEGSGVQIAAILGVRITALSGSFKTLFEDRVRLQEIVASLIGLRTRTQDLKTRFAAFSAGIKTVSIGLNRLLDVWDNVAARVSIIAEDGKFVLAPQAEQLKNAWAKASTDAKEYIDILQGSTSELLGTVAASRSGINLAAGAPAEPQKALGDSTGRVIDQFNTLLLQPGLDQYKFPSPIDGSNSNLYNIVLYNRDEYIKLQNDTLPVARDLHAYAGSQATLLPFVVPDDEAQAPYVALSTFLQTHAPLLTDYMKKADPLHIRSVNASYAADNVVKIIQVLLAELEVGKVVGDALTGLVGNEVIPAEKITAANNELKAAGDRDRLQVILAYAKAIAESLSWIASIWADLRRDLMNLDAFYTALSGPAGHSVLNAVRPSIINYWEAVREGAVVYIAVVSGP